MNFFAEPKYKSSILILILLFLSSLYISLSQAYHSFHSADTLLLPYIAWEHWKPFYWDQNRFGLPLVWLAGLVPHPFYSMVFYYFLCVLISNLGLFFLLKRILFKANFSKNPEGLNEFLITLAIICWVPLPEYHEFTFQPYGVSLGFFMLGLYAKDKLSSTPFSYLALFVFSFLSLWVNIGFLVFGFFYFGLLLKEQNRKAPLFSLFSFLASTFCVYLLMLTEPTQPRYQAIMHPKFFWEAFKGVFNHALPNYDGQFFVLFLLVGLGGVLLYFKSKNQLKDEHRINTQTALHFLAVASLNIFVFTIMAWNRSNSYHHRYLLTGFFVVFALYLAIFLNPFFIFRSFKYFFGGLLFWAMLSKFGIPGSEHVWQGLKNNGRNHSVQALKLGCTHFLGSYWDTWYTVAVARMLKPQNRLQGLAARANDNKANIMESFKAQSVLVFCSVQDDPEALNQFNIWLGYVPTKTSTQDGLDIYQVKAL